MSVNQRNPVVAGLGQRSPHPYSSIAASPSRRHAIVAAKDTLTVLSVGPNGLSQTKSFRISQHFQTAVASSPSAAATNSTSKPHQYGDIRETFGLMKPAQTPSNMTASEATVNCTHVAWSLPQTPNSSDSFHDNESPSYTKQQQQRAPDTVIAAAGSNGLVVVWSVSRSIFSKTNNPIPEAVLSQHTRAVNRLAWHPTGRRPELLLTASQDATVKLWERRTLSSQKDGSAGSAETPNIRSWFGMHSPFLQNPNLVDKSVSWHCKATFQPHSEAVRDIVWSPFHDDVFAVVTGSGSLIVYNINVPARPWVKVAAHSGEATSVDWHPTRPYVIATGGGSQDRRVKIWDLESSMCLATKDERNISRNSSSVRSDLSRESETSNDETTVRAGSTRNSPTQDSSDSGPLTYTGATRSLSLSTHSVNSARGVHKFVAADTLHVLVISASVTRLRWRPPVQIPSLDGQVPRDPHDAMLAVATAPIKGASAGGSGILSLWSHNRPFMPLSVVEGHKEGAISDFIWLDTPEISPAPPVQSPEYTYSPKSGRRRRRRTTPTGSDHASSEMARRHTTSNESAMYPYGGDMSEDIRSTSTSGVWQHVLSVGRDGRCLLQSFARGERQISRVPPSCFTMANLSPFQSGYGSLQIFSVHQNVPSSPKDDFLLTGLRRDSTSARAPGVFQELPIDDDDEEDVTETEFSELRQIQGVRHPATVPKLVFNVLDQGELGDLAVQTSESQSTYMVAPEVVHLSRFAESYKLYPDETCPTRVDLCLHNGTVAEGLNCGPLARMWRMLASILQGSGQNQLPLRGSCTGNAMEFVLLPTLRSLLEQRADAGDCQTCVAICEVMQVIEKSAGRETTKPGETNDTRIPGLELNLVREWYLSYIDLLQQMCLFSHATNLIRNCNDAFIGALNQQSTTIHESCPHCRKPLQGGEAVNGIARRTCKSCRRRVGLCFLCHEPVKGVFVWCPGCGHGGHLDHALQWFGGMSGKPVREVCPTGCGHKCNLVQQVSAFPTTTSLLRCSPINVASLDDPLTIT